MGSFGQISNQARTEGSEFITSEPLPLRVCVAKLPQASSTHALSNFIGLSFIELVEFSIDYQVSTLPTASSQ
jgi:hypothetical protein